MDQWTPNLVDDAQWYCDLQALKEHALDHLDVYLDNFISTCPGGSQERTKMLCHIFQKVYMVFLPNKDSDLLQK